MIVLIFSDIVINIRIWLLRKSIEKYIFIIGSIIFIRIVTGWELVSIVIVINSNLRRV